LVVSRAFLSGDVAPLFSYGGEDLKRPTGREVCDMIVSDGFLENKNQNLAETSDMTEKVIVKYECDISSQYIFHNCYCLVYSMLN
jgi:hypothetical protein